MKFRKLDTDSISYIVSLKTQPFKHVLIYMVIPWFRQIILINITLI
jgi:hypothetical protein